MGRTFTDFVSKERRDDAITLCLVGAGGRLGSAIQEAAQSMQARVVATVDEGNDAPTAAVAFDIVVDASRPEGTRRATEIAVNKGVPIVVCTTGLDDACHAMLKEAAKTIPVLLAPNTSPGVAAVRRIVESIAGMVREWEVKITETHHKNKFDKPSGTARLLAKSIESVRGEVVPDSAIESLRTGDVVGEHTVVFRGLNEEITIEHRALDRSLFGRGAIRAAKWLCGQTPGMYTIEDTLE